MAGITPYYGLAYFDFGDQLDTPLNVQAEINRFMVIDKQMYAIYSIFGSGVINGWEVSDNGYTVSNGISVMVSAGTGIIRYIACISNLPNVINGLPPNSNVFIYALLQGNSSQDNNVQFTWSLAPLSSSVVLLANVQTGSTSVTSINNSLQSQISFQQIITNEINAHHHRGIPTKIDLQLETQNQLPGAKIEGIDASQVISGQLPIGRIPQIDHNALENIGLLTHTQLDSFVKTLNSNNQGLLGEVASTNLLRQMLFLKYMFPDVDQNFVNEIAFIPGISSSSMVDIENTTAYVNYESECISGAPGTNGQFVDIVWNSANAWNNAVSQVNLNIQPSEVMLQSN